MSNLKSRERADIDQGVKEFLKGGGKIKRLRNGDSGDPRFKNAGPHARSQRWKEKNMQEYRIMVEAKNKKRS